MDCRRYRKAAKIDPTRNYKIVEYSPKGKDNALKDPTGLLIDPVTGDIYISEHEGIQWQFSILF